MDSIDKIKPLSALHDVAECYHRDAIDFADRFDALWERNLHKTGRIKTFVDLLMGCECALKCHAILSHLNDDPQKTYERVRKCGHDIGRLVKLVAFMEDRTSYEALEKELSSLSVFLRYSLEAYDTFFPFNFDDAKIDYSKTIGNNCWVVMLRAHLGLIIEKSGGEFTGFVSDDIGAILRVAEEVKLLLQKK